ncbi:MAG TPA: tRNA glutamyl-Q(34) synthetase GluQRS [Rhodothermales bacterium]|nr:tRNA glutamyl-Q(34) synthetase GluQRS [Rhodothermales bacterium]
MTTGASYQPQSKIKYPISNILTGRYAPSPTGLLHVGSARTALVAWLSARAAGGRFVMRVEDLDGPRTVPGMTDAILDDLRWLGIDWDEGPDVGGPHAPYLQSERFGLYEEALKQLYAQERLFPCRRSRKDLQALATAPHGAEGLPPYPARWRPRQLEADWFDVFCGDANPDAALRFRIADEPVTFEDRIYGTVIEYLDQTVGDFVLKRRDGVYAYQLAVVVDDLLMGINEVVRGEDLLASTARQIQLIEALGGTVPAYAHVPLVVNAEGEKLSKRDEGLTLQSLREAGVAAAAFVGLLGYSLGLLPEPTPCTASDLIERFSWDRLPRTPWRLPPDISDALRKA